MAVEGTGEQNTFLQEPIVQWGPANSYKMAAERSMVQERHMTGGPDLVRRAGR